jgi:probable phosphoglycerate mutase
MTVQLLLVRHGHPHYPTDSLTELGHQEAQTLAAALDDYPIDALYVSTMGRARQTAAYTAQRRVLTPMACDWLRELDGRYGFSVPPAEWTLEDPSPSAYEVPAAHIMARSELFSYEGWQNQVPYGPWMRPQCDALFAAFDAVLADEGYGREGLRYAVRARNHRTIAFFCHGGVIAALLSHMLYITLPVALSLFQHDTAGFSLLRSAEEDGHAAFRMLFINNVAHKDVAEIVRHP